MERNNVIQYNYNHNRFIFCIYFVMVPASFVKLKLWLRENEYGFLSRTLTLLKSESAILINGNGSTFRRVLLKANTDTLCLCKPIMSHKSSTSFTPINTEILVQWKWKRMNPLNDYVLGATSKKQASLSGYLHVLWHNRGAVWDTSAPMQIPITHREKVVMIPLTFTYDPLQCKERETQQ